MKSSTLVLWCSALLNVSWGQRLALLLLAPPESMDQAKVMAKKDSDGEPIVMSRATDDHESRPLCATDVFTMSLDCNEENRYHGFATLNFAHPTDLPRPLTLTMPDYTLHVSFVSMHQSQLTQSAI